jgi:hypothetical protein
LAVSRLISRPKKKKKAAADPQQTSGVVNWGPGISRNWETERAELVRSGKVVKVSSEKGMQVVRKRPSPPAPAAALPLF